MRRLEKRLQALESVGRQRPPERQAWTMTQEEAEAVADILEQAGALEAVLEDGLFHEADREGPFHEADRLFHETDRETHRGA